MAVHAQSLYVEIPIRGPMDHVWNRTQSPELHEKWDLRFSTIQYLPRPDAALPQRFLYATRIGFGVRICGEGESVGTADGPGGERTSALKFWSHDPKSLIREGSGYWKYIPSAGGDGVPIRFLTRYDYDVRFGVVGRILDRLVFRRMLGWATAWSFDRLRLWIEKDIDPALSMRLWLIHLVSRLTLGCVFVYQGLVPKLIARHPDELAMLGSLGLAESALAWCIGIGCAEVALGLGVILAWRLRWPIWLILGAMPISALAVASSAPEHLIAPFNPITLNLLVFAAAATVLMGGHDLPSAARCLRQPPRRNP